MSVNQYLQNVLRSQTFKDGDPELKALREKRNEIETLLRNSFSGVTIRYAGSYAKETMILASYDLDLTCYFSHDDTQAGASLEQIYNSVQSTLEKSYWVRPKTSSLQLEERGEDKKYTHIDVVPGRFISGRSGDVFLYQNGAEKNRLKTNLDVHIEAIKESGLTDTIRLVKYWREQQGFRAKTFVLELLVVKILTPYKFAGLEKQLVTFWECLRDSYDSITIEDPANPEGNDLMPILNEIKPSLQFSADSSLRTIANSGWEQVLGDPSSAVDEAGKLSAIANFAQVRSGGAKPWSE